jgi:O-antigen ligase
MRWVLYREGVAMLEAHPYMGVGAARFGEFSCTGSGGFPHSLILQGFAELGLFGGGLLVGLFALATVTLLRPFLPGRQASNWSADVFVLALFTVFLVADQIYGNYFMSVGAWLMLGIAASMRSNIKQRGVSHG